MIASQDEILSILETDARATPASIAAITGLPESEVKARIEKYESTGVIRGYRGFIDWDKAGVEKVIAFIDVKVTPARDVGFDAVANRIAKFPEIQSVWLVSGESDLRVLVEAKSVRALGQFVAEKLSTIDGVSGTITHFLLRRYKEDHVMFVDGEETERLVITP